MRVHEWHVSLIAPDEVCPFREMASQNSLANGCFAALEESSAFPAHCFVVLHSQQHVTQAGKYGAVTDAAWSPENRQVPEAALRRQLCG